MEITTFKTYLATCDRIVALCGAGLSAASGLPTFRGTGGYWRTHESMALATPSAFNEDPSLVWQFYSYRRHHALKVSPNPGHLALSKFAEKRGEKFLTITQNVDGLSTRAGHKNVERLHGSLFDVRCSRCNYSAQNFDDPICPALTVSGDQAQIPVSELPTCPNCHSLLRPGVVWFGESLPEASLLRIDKYMQGRVDLILVIGTSATVYPAAGYINQARTLGAEVAVINIEEPEHSSDWYFQGSAADVLPLLL